MNMNKHIILYCISLLCLLACDGMNDNIKEYLDRGEINYIGIPDSATAAGGINRIKFTWKVNADPRIKFCKIYWNEKQDSATIPVDRSQIDVNGYISCMLTDMPEGSFIFNLHHASDESNQSIRSEVSGTIYGELYQSMLSPRKVKRVEALVDQANIYWGDAGNSSGLVLTYVNKDGATKELEVAPTETVTEILDYKLGGTFTYKTFFLPEKDALDIFEINSTEEKFPEYYIADGLQDSNFPEYTQLDRSVWSVLTFSSEEPTGEGANGRAAQIIDNNPATFWHSQWSASTAQLPHHIALQMNAEKSIKCVTIAKRQNNTDVRSAHVEVSLDNVKWTIIGKVEFAKAANPNAKTIVLGELVRARYIKLVITESHRAPSASISELYVLGTE